ncbi:MAG: MarR family transcriptional regulator [Actinomycetota bacterium]|nr:MarR family transcriptional regulator [Actinomycetota bacterium]
MADPAELVSALRRFGLENDRLDAIVARRIEAGAIEFKAMNHLHTVDELTPGQLGDRLALTSGAVTALIDRLERHGWVERVPHPTDRRSVVIRRARQSGVVPRLYRAYGKRLQQAAAVLSEEECAACLAFLEQASAAAAATADEVKGSASCGRPPPA